MLGFRAVLFAALLCVLFPRGAAAQEPAGPVSLQIPKIEWIPRPDDYLPGKSAPGALAEGFRQRDPGDLVAVSETTRAYLSYDDANLYVAFVCTAANPSSIRARLSRRESIFSDDWVGVFLDPFKERQHAYFFAANPIGVEADGTTTEGRGGVDTSFDTVWSAQARRTPDGYIVVLSIPFKSLRFPSGSSPSEWGVALERAIPTNSEESFWPGITRRVNGFTSQFGSLSGITGVSPGRNAQFIPYGTFTGARLRSDATGGRQTNTDPRAGVDAKVVLHDKIAVDATFNPDFSQVESDEPQVTINQRFEVFFPEKRPFFLENADYFQTPITLFFSRRVGDPQAGTRVTGRAGRWSIGALAMDDRQPGRQADPGTDGAGDRAFNGVAVARRDFANQSRVGFMATRHDFAGSSNTVSSADTRVRINPQWFVEGQLFATSDTALDGTSTTGGGAWAAVHRSGRRFTEDFSYQDVSANARVPLGFVPRLDIRQLQQFATWRWYPKRYHLTSIGPNSFAQATWDHSGQIQDWIVRYPVNLRFGQTFVFARHAQIMERFGGTNFREHENLLNVSSSAISWMEFGASIAAGTRPNFFPADGLAPFLAEFTDASLGVTFRPLARLLLDETYIYSRLSRRTGSIFDNHIARSRVNFQFTKVFSLRAIVDYNAVLPDVSLVGLDRQKHLTGDVLCTWLVHPGTATYIGYTDAYDNQRRGLADPAFSPSGPPTISTGRQFFVKTSYLFRF